jgi:RecB family exonuclease
MQLIFAADGDGPVFPDFPGGGAAAVDAAVVGPLGLLSILETRLGLGGPPSAASTRIAAYAHALQSALDDDPSLFFARSVEIDPWATAKLLLGWRDQLIQGGWDGAAPGHPRLDAMAAVETRVTGIAPAIGERVKALCAALQARRALGIASISLADHGCALEPGIAELMACLAAAGVAVSESPLAPAAPADSDLGRVQRFLLHGQSAPLQGDGSFVLVDAETALLAADTVAEWLAAGEEAAAATTLLLVENGDSALLDKALGARGLPALGLSATSPWRGALQLLPLAFAVAWAPFDPKPLLDLLLLPRPPIPRYAATRLIRALTREPGSGDEAHAEAWAQIEAWAATGDPLPEPAKVAERLARWRSWVEGGRHMRSEGMPLAAVREISARVAAWAIDMDRGAEDPLLLAVAQAASVLSDAVSLLGRDPVPSLLLERMIADVLADGAANTDHVAEAGRLRSVHAAGALWDVVPELIWWDFTGGARPVRALPWSLAERAALSRLGVQLDDPARQAASGARRQLLAICRASERALLVSPERSAHNERTSHPVAHQLEPLLRDHRERVRFNAARLCGEAEPVLAQRTIRRIAMRPRSSPGARPHWRLPDAVGARLAARRESATSFERLIDCQMRWLLQDVLRLRRGRFAELPGGNQLLGNLAHAVAKAVFVPGPIAAAEDIDVAIGAAFDRQLPAIAAALRLPEHAGELAAARDRVPAAIRHLAALLRDRGIEVVAAEVERDGTRADGLALTGQLDLLVRHPVHGLGVIDLKWTNSPNRRRKELAEGRSIQLATYGVIADPADPLHAPGAYYLLAQRRLLAPSGSFLADEEVVVSRSLAETWSVVEESWRLWRETARAGDAFASGIAAAVETMPLAPLIAAGEPCRFCDMTGLCRIRVHCA